VSVYAGVYVCVCVCVWEGEGNEWVIEERETTGQ